jgi:hypothetical protein
MRLIDEVEGRPVGPEPAWFTYPAVGETSITTPAMLEPFTVLNRGKPYAHQIKPFNFNLIAHIDPLVPLPEGTDRSRFALVAPYSADPATYLDLPWRTATTAGHIPSRPNLRASLARSGSRPTATSSPTTVFIPK